MKSINLNHKVRTVLLGSVGLMLAASCSKQPSCNSSETKELMKSFTIKAYDNYDGDIPYHFKVFKGYRIIKNYWEKRRYNYDFQNIELNNSEKTKMNAYVENLMDDYFDIKDTRLTKKNEKLKQCSCEGTSVISETAKENLKKRFLEIVPKEGKIMELIDDLDTENNVKYDLQISEEGDLLGTQADYFLLHDYLRLYKLLLLAEDGRLIIENGAFKEPEDRPNDDDDYSIKDYHFILEKK